MAGNRATLSRTILVIPLPGWSRTLNASDSALSLFEPGVPAFRSGIPLCVPELRGNEWKYIKECLDTGWVSSVGKFVERFEKMVAQLVGTQYAVATASGTAALHMALLVAGIQPDDEVLMPALTFIAPANAIRYAGAWPIFLDAEPVYWQLDPQKLTDFLARECYYRDNVVCNKKTNRHVKAILPVHVLGHPVDMAPILAIAAKYNLVVIEDAAESLGAQYRGRTVGSLGDIACLSFNGNKLITTGGGGMIVTDNESWAAKARYLTTQAKDDPVEYIHGHIGFNYRLTNLQAALGCAQLESLHDYVAAKRNLAARYTDAFKSESGLCPMREAGWAFSTFWMYTILLDERIYGRDRRSLGQLLAEHQIQSRPLWQPLHRSPAHAGCQSYHVEVADLLYKRALSLPSSVGLTGADLQRVIETVKNVSHNMILAG